MKKLIGVLVAVMFGLGSVSGFAASHTGGQPMKDAKKDEMKKADKAPAKTAMSKEEKAKAKADAKAAKAKARAEAKAAKAAKAKEKADMEAAKAKEKADMKKDAKK